MNHLFFIRQDFPSQKSQSWHHLIVFRIFESDTQLRRLLPKSLFLMDVGSLRQNLAMSLLGSGRGSGVNQVQSGCALLILLSVVSSLFSLSTQWFMWLNTRGEGEDLFQVSKKERGEMMIKNDPRETASSRSEPLVSPSLRHGFCRTIFFFIRVLLCVSSFCEEWLVCLHNHCHDNMKYDFTVIISLPFSLLHWVRKQ